MELGSVFFQPLCRDEGLGLGTLKGSLHSEQKGNLGRAGRSLGEEVAVTLGGGNGGD